MWAETGSFSPVPEQARCRVVARGWRNGSRTALRWLRSQGHGGSTPLPRTTVLFINNAPLSWAFIFLSKVVRFKGNFA
ncbi:MAG: hypothetical protein UT67_C0002G0014 [Candidatus Magasanikbacteria bacterium GW2011_GWA2_40_10]|uniref:Uncharacterized protein n=1 Tax=Candidatus Magasanikbacteria bacterium GW2011_GWA2_40_10 TaxID=1619037 RepID=A0A0G0SKW8_9BACT|nr:MAG: hypothetical protein UT67_C0002G0014 [Candidatus Magasanikbacteria bacterium GW2011_GWA2_40_10]